MLQKGNVNEFFLINRLTLSTKNMPWLLILVLEAHTKALEENCGVLDSIWRGGDSFWSHWGEV